MDHPVPKILNPAPFQACFMVSRADEIYFLFSKSPLTAIAYMYNLPGYLVRKSSRPVQAITLKRNKKIAEFAPSEV